MPNPNHRIEGGGVGERIEGGGVGERIEGGGVGERAGESETIKSEFLKVL